MSFKINSFAEYQEHCLLAKNSPKEFWSRLADNFTWNYRGKEVFEYDFHKGTNQWFKDSKVNITTNCLDRHLHLKANDIALIWEPNNPNDQVRKLAYWELHREVMRFSALLKKKRIQKGDRVCIYMPMIPEAVIAMLACARIGAIHSVVFAGFSAKSLASRLDDCGAKLLITSDRLYRGDKVLNLLETVSEALNESGSIKEVIIYKRSDDKIDFPVKYSIWQEEICDEGCEPEEMNAEDPLFILYTSGSTGKPKGVMHTTAGYMIYTAYSFQNVFQYNEGDVYFCTADIGWITGHSYLVYGPLLCGATTLMFEGVPTYPNPSRFWEVIQKHNVNIFYTAPTAIRALMQKGDEFVDKYNLKSLKTLGTVGEPINLEAWNWYNEKVGKGRCPIVDTWWQTETGGILISALSGITKPRATYASLPLPGIFPVILDNEGNKIEEAAVKGNLCFELPWPSMIRSVWGDHEKCRKTYYESFKGYYFSGDGCFKSSDGYFRIIGRVDDVINSSGHRIGTAEVENAINMHHAVVESAVIGYPHEIKGEGICAFVITKKDHKISEKEVAEIVAQQIGAIARPDKIIFTPDLPKTRSGKIMRRILRKIMNKEDDVGDVSTLVNPEIVEVLKEKLQV